MPNVTITQLPAAGPIQGDELVPIVQNGQTLRTTASALAGSPVQTQTFLTLNQEPTLINSRRLSGGTGIGLIDGGALSTLQIALNGTSGSLESASTGVIVKTGASSVTARSIAVSGIGLAIADGSGVSGNPTISLDGLIAAIAQVGGTGLLAIQNGTTAGGVLIAGTGSQIDVANGNGLGGNPTISLSANPVIPGTAGMVVPVGTTAQQPAGLDGQFRFNSDTQTFDGYSAGQWRQFSVAGGFITTFSAGTTGFTPSTPTTGSIVLAGILNPDSGGTGVNNGSNTIAVGGNLSTGGAFTVSGAFSTTLTATNTTSVTLPITGTLATLDGAETFTNKTISGSNNTLSNIANSSLTNSSVTYNGVTVALGASGTITAATPNALTVGTGLQLNSGTTFDGSAAKTISIDSTVATLTGSQTLTNKTISGSNNTLTDIGNGSLTNSAVTVGTTSISLGSSSLTLGGLTSVAVTQDPTSALQLATKQYVDAVAEGLHIHASCAAATTGTLASITGGTVTYNNGSSGVGATLTLSVALTTLDGYTLQNGDRVLVKDEATQANNGIYTWATGGTVLTRATDFDTAAEMASGDFTFVSNGTLYANTGWVQTDPVTTVGTSPVIWVQFSGAGTYTAGTGLTLTGSQFSLTSPVAVSLGGTGFTSYTGGDILYASAATTLSKLGIGTNGYVLTSSGSAPQWSAQSSLIVGTATNIAGGLANQVPYQSAPSTTTFSSNLTFNGSLLSVTGDMDLTGALDISNGTDPYYLYFAPNFGLQVGGNGVGIDVGDTANALTSYIQVKGANGTNLNLRVPKVTSNYSYVSGGGAGTTGAQVRFVVENSATNATSLVLATHNGTSFSTSTFDSSGNLGIGTSSPSYKLDVAGAINASGNITSGGVLQALTTVQSSSGADLSLNANGANRDVIWKVNGTELARLVGSTGNLGIGTSSPLYQVVILRRTGSTITAPLLNLQSQTSGSVDGDSFILYGTQSANWAAGVDQADSNKFRIEPNTTLGGADGLTITTGGNLGIGTSSPATKLEVSGSAAVARISGTSASVPQLSLSSSGVVNWSLRANNDGGSDFTIYQDSTQRLKIDSSGNLGLGVTPSAWGSPLGSAFLEAKNGMHFGSIGTSVSIGYIGVNSYYNGTNWIYKNSTYSNRYELNSGNTGVHAWFTAASGTAGNAISFSQAMTLTSAGVLCVGATSNTSRGGSNSTLLTYKASGTNYLDIQCGSSGDSGLLFSTASTGNYGLIVYGNSAGNMQFYTASGERMRIDSSGNVGIGTSSPSAKLDVNGGSSNTIVTATGSSANAANIYVSNSNSGSYFTLGAYGGTGFSVTGWANSTVLESVPASTGGLVLSAYSNNIIFQTNARAERMRLDSSGNLGIGVTPPADWASSGYKAFVVRTSFLAGSTAPGTMALGNNAYNDGAGWKYVATGTSTLYVQATGGHYWYQAASGTAGNAITFSQPMTLDPNGNLGVGTTTPFSGAITIARGSGVQASVEIAGNGTTAGSTSLSLIQATDSTAYVYNRANTALIFGTNNTERARITSGGDFGIGTTSPSYRLHVSTTAYGAIGVYRALDVTSVGAAGQLIEIGALNGSTPTPGASIQGVLNNPATSGYLTFQTRSSNTLTERARITSDGDVGIGTTSPTAKLHIKGGNTNNLKVDNDGSQYTEVDWLNNGTIKAVAYWDNTATQFLISAQAASSSLAFGAAGSERARITSGGAWQVNTSGIYTQHTIIQRAANEDTLLLISPRVTASQNFGIYVQYSAADPNGTGNPFFSAEGNGTLRAQFRSNGGLANYSANDVNLSDRREKTNFAPAKSYLDTICAIPVQTFNYIDQSEDDPGLTLGVVAQDVQAVAPELVMESNWGTKDDPKMRLSIYQTDLQYALMKCIQELKSELDSVKAELATLKGN